MRGVDELQPPTYGLMVWAAAVANSGIISWTIIITLALAAMWMATTINTIMVAVQTVSILQGLPTYTAINAITCAALVTRVAPAAQLSRDIAELQHW